MWKLGRSGVICLRNRFSLIIHSPTETYFTSLKGFGSELFFQGVQFVGKIFPLEVRKWEDKSLKSALDFVICGGRVVQAAHPVDTLWEWRDFPGNVLLCCSLRHWFREAFWKKGTPHTAFNKYSQTWCEITPDWGTIICGVVWGFRVFSADPEPSWSQEIPQSPRFATLAQGKSLMASAVSPTCGYRGNENI